MKRHFFTCLALLVAATFAHADQGNPKLKSIEAIAFGPNGLLIIGSGTQVVTVETGDTKAPRQTGRTGEIANIDQDLAGKLGLTAKDIQIRKLAVNPASQKAYIASARSRRIRAVLLTVDSAGKIGEFSLENVKYTRYPLSRRRQGGHPAHRHHLGRQPHRRAPRKPAIPSARASSPSTRTPRTG